MSVETWVHRWWAGETGVAGSVLRTALAPAEGAFRGIVALRNRGYDQGLIRSECVPIPVVSVGNLAVGGAGKTPVSAWIARRLAEWGRRPAIALRGYGDDEVAVHRELNPDVPVFRGARRIEAAREAVASGRDAVVLDDAFQHRALQRDADLVLIAAEGWTERPRLLPRGPWREGFGALARADAAIVTRKSASAERAREVADRVGRMHPTLPVAIIALRPAALVSLHRADRLPLDALAGKSVLAVAALATPEPFLDHLRERGATVDAALYADHHAFTQADADTLADRAAGRWMVMTHKDAVKLRPLLPDGTEAYVLEQSVEIEGGADRLDAVLRRALEGGNG